MICRYFSRFLILSGDEINATISGLPSVGLADLFYGNLDCSPCRASRKVIRDLRPIGDRFVVGRNEIRAPTAATGPVRQLAVEKSSIKPQRRRDAESFSSLFILVLQTTPMSDDVTETISASPRLGGEFDLAVRENRKLTFPVQKSNKSRLYGKLRYWWCWFAAGALLLVVGARRRFSLDHQPADLALSGRTLGRKDVASGVRCEGQGHRSREPRPDGQQYVFASNHRSYLDTATLFRYAGKRMGLVAKKELLKAADPRAGDGICEHHRDRSLESRACSSIDGKSP